MSALDISHQQSSAPSSGGMNSFGAFNFAPVKGINPWHVMAAVAVVAVIYLAKRRRK